MPSRKRVAAAVLAFPLLVLSLGCGKLPELTGLFEDDAEDTADGAGSKPTAEQECGGADFPCRWDAVPEKVAKRMQDVAGEALGWGRAGLSAEAIAAKLDEADDVVVLGFSEDSIRYRVRGGRPAWVFLATAGTVRTIGGAISIPSKLPVMLGPWMGPAGGPHGPVGDAEPGKKPKKKVLILSPFRWQWQLDGKDDNGKWYSDDEVETLETLFGAVEDYEGGGVVLKQNTWTGPGIDFGVTTSDFASWKDYDVIHVSTHGTSCDKPTRQCSTALATGEFWPADWFEAPQGLDPTQDPDSILKQALKDELLSQGFDMGFIPIAASDAEQIRFLPGLRVVEETAKPDPAKQGVKADGGKALMAGDTTHFAGPFVLINSEFFSQTYQGKLADKIIFVSACKSGTKSDLIDALEGPATAVIGWDKVMQLSTATQGALAFWSQMTDPGRQGDDAGGGVRMREGGIRVSEAFKLLEERTEGSGVLEVGPTKSIVIEGIVTEDDATGAKLEPTGDETTRAREIIRLLDGKGRSKLADGDLISMVGAPGDGEPDKLQLHAEVVGIADGDDPGDYVVHVDVDGREARGTFKPTQKVRPGVWQGKGEVELGFDLEQPTFVLEPWVELPDGGTSRWYYEDIGAQYFVVTISGSALSPGQTFSIPPDKIKLHAFDDSMTLMFQDHLERNAMSNDGSVLHVLIGGVSEPALGIGTFEAGSDKWGWSMDVWLRTRGCEHNYKGCKHLMLKTAGGPLKITKYQLGKGIARPHAKGPTVVSGTLDFTTRVTSMYQADQTYSAKGSFTLVE